MSLTGRGVFDGDAPESTTFIFDGSTIFDTQITEPVPANEIIVFTHGSTDLINVFTHGNEIIPRQIQ